MNYTSETKPILVLGGSGKTGRRVVERLAHAGFRRARAAAPASRRSTGTTRDTWAPVLHGVGSVYVQHYLDALPGAAEIIGNFAELAVASGSRGSCSSPAAARPRRSAPSRSCGTPAPS